MLPGRSSTPLALARLEDREVPVVIAGTDFNDLITITRGIGSTARVTVRAFADTAWTQLVQLQTYTLPDVSFGLDVRTGTGNDGVEMVGVFQGGVTVDGGTGIDTAAISSPGVLTGYTNAGNTPTQRIITSPFGTTAVNLVAVESARVWPQSPVTSVTLNGRVYTFVIGADGKLKANELAGPGWTVYTTRDPSSTYAAGTPLAATAVQGTNGAINVFAVDVNGNIRQTRFNANTSTWTNGQVTTTGPFASGTPLAYYENPSSGVINLFGVNTAGNIVQVRYGPLVAGGPYQWSGPHNVTTGGAFAARTPLAYYENPATGVINLFAVNTSGNIVQVRYSGGWSGPHNVTSGGAFVAGTTLSYYENSAGVINLFAVNKDGQVVQVRYSGGWSGPHNVTTVAGQFVPGTPLAYFENPSTGIINLFAVSTPNSPTAGRVVQVRYAPPPIPQAGSFSWTTAALGTLGGVGFVPGTPLTYTGDDSNPLLYGLGLDGFVRRVAISGGAWGATFVDSGTSLIVS
jgi:hypothetical protein